MKGSISEGKAKIMPAATDLYKTLGIKKSASADEIKQVFRKLAAKYHPDHNHDKKAEEIFKNVLAAYEILSDKAKRERYDNTGSAAAIIIPTKQGKYTLESLHTSGDICDVYKATKNDGTQVAFKIVKDPRNNDLVDNEIKVLGELFPQKQKEEKRFRYLPRQLDSIKINDGTTQRQVNILSWLDNFHTLSHVRESFSAKLQMEHSVWMFNRLLSAIDFVHSRGYVHGALTPEHVLAYDSGLSKDPYNHGIKIIDWSYAVKVNSNIKAISPKYEAFYPPEVFAKRPANQATDIYMAAKCIIYVLGGDVSNDSTPSHVPEYFKSFLKSCTLKTQGWRPQNAGSVYKDFEVHMGSNYGPKKYVPFHLPQIS